MASSLAIGQVAHADPGSLNGEPLTVSLLESGDPALVLTNTITAGPGGPQINGNDYANPIGDPVGNYLFSQEWVDAHDLQIVYHIQGSGGAYTGGAPECSGSPGCSLWGDAPDDARFQFSDLNFGSPGIILQSVALTQSNVFGAQVDQVTANSFEVIFGSAGVLNSTINGTPALGTLTMDLHTQVSPVPLPPSLVMLLGGLIAIVYVGHRRRPYSTSIRS